MVEVVNTLIQGHIFQMQSHGGISRIYQEILPRMCEFDPSIEIQIVCDPRHGRLKQNLRPRKNITTPFVPMPHSSHIFAKAINKFSSYIFWNSKINHENVDVWHSTFFDLPSHKTIPYVITVYDMISELFLDQYPSLYTQHKSKKEAVNRADVIITISETTKQDLCRWYSVPQDRVISIPLAASTFFRQLNHDDLELPAGIPDDFILYVGRREIYKNFERLLEAYRKWTFKDKFALVIVGPPWLPSDDKYVNNITTENIHLLPQISDEELLNLYNKAALFVYPSLYEGFGIPILEAMQCHCPIAISDIEVHREVAGETAIFFDPEDCSSIIDALTKGVHTQRDDAIIQLAFQRSKMFDWNQTAKATLDVYKMFQK